MNQVSIATATTGRPTVLTLATFDLLTELISRRGVSDSAAARQIGLSTSSLSRWKQQNPDFAVALLQARETFRQTQLERILTASHNPRTGWRAAAWLLERIFPEDYHPNATQRANHQQLAESRETEAETAAADFPPQLLPEHSQPSTCNDQLPSASSVSRSQNSQKSASAPAADVPPQPSTINPQLLPTPAAPSETDSHNSQNSRPFILPMPILTAA